MANPLSFLFGNGRFLIAPCCGILEFGNALYNSIVDLVKRTIEFLQSAICFS